MRLLTLIIFFLALPWNTIAQWYDWSEPFPMTDSLSDNINPFLHYSWDNGEAVYMVWENSMDSISTEIWLDNILDANPPQLVLADSGIHYTHPKILGDWGSYGEILFYLFYQSDESGNEDIYAVPYMLDGTWGDPEAIAVTPDDDVQLSVSRDMFADATTWIRGLVSWISGDDLYACFLQKDGSSYYLDDPILIDSGICSSPSVIGIDNYERMLYNRLDSNGQHIYKASYNINTGWDPPGVFFDSLESKNPTAASYYIYPVWSVKTDSNWQIMIKDWNDYEVYNISSAEPFDPAALGVFFGVKSWFPEIIVAVEYPKDSVTEIFMTVEMGSGDFANFSNSGTENRHPQFFYGESDTYNSWCWNNYLVWESTRNGHWQIWGAKYIMCGGGINDAEESHFIKVFPNPFEHETNIELTLDADVIITAEIFDQYGKQVITLVDKYFLQGTHQLRWNTEGIAPGIYLLRVKVGKELFTCKLIKR